jgi:hypothetical protein
MFVLSFIKSSDKSIDFILFLNMIINNKPIENSKLANPNIKKLLLKRVKSLLETPVIIV